MMLTMLTTSFSILLFTLLCNALPLVSPRNHALNTINLSPDGRVLFAPSPSYEDYDYAPILDPCLGHATLPHYTTYRYPKYSAPTIIQLARTETTMPAPAPAPASAPVPVPIPVPVPVPAPFQASPIVQVGHPDIKVGLPTEREDFPQIGEEAPCEAPTEPIAMPYFPDLSLTEEKQPVLIPMHEHALALPEAPYTDAGIEFDLKKHKVYDPISVVVLKNVGNKVLDSDVN